MALGLGLGSSDVALGWMGRQLTFATVLQVHHLPMLVLLDLALHLSSPTATLLLAGLRPLHSLNPAHNEALQTLPLSLQRQRLLLPLSLQHRLVHFLAEFAVDDFVDHQPSSEVVTVGLEWRFGGESHGCDGDCQHSADINFISGLGFPSIALQLPYSGSDLIEKGILLEGAIIKAVHYKRLNSTCVAKSSYHPPSAYATVATQFYYRKLENPI